jgi:hypothetical protein
MGFYFRRSISFGGLRFNFSKSGIGVSAGIKGFRIGTGPRGNYIHAGRNGFYYRQTIPTNNSKVKPQNTSQAIEEYNFQEIESGNVSFMTDNSFESILDEINSKYAKIRFWPILLSFAIVASIVNAYCLFSLVLPILAFFWDKKRKTIYIIYDIDEEMESKLQAFYDSFESVKNAKYKWHISSQAELNKLNDIKHNAGASNLVRRTSISISDEAPKNFITNIKVPKIPVGKQTLFFFPERILIFEKNRVGTVNYKDLRISYSNTKFIESGNVPSDTEIIGYTWRYVNKKGGPDKRFKDNVQIPIVLYSEIHFQSNSGLNEMLNISRKDLGSELEKALSDFCK